MIQTEVEIIEKAIKIMTEIKWGFAAEGIKAFFNSKEEAIEEDKKYVKDPKLLEFAIQNAKPDYWTVGFDFEPEAEIEYNRMFLDIWDETGEPYEIRHKQARFKILKNEEGGYYTELI